VYVHLAVHNVPRSKLVKTYTDKRLTNENSPICNDFLSLFRTIFNHAKSVFRPYS
jgi:polyphosphate kinase